MQTMQITYKTISDTAIIVSQWVKKNKIADLFILQPYHNSHTNVNKIKIKE